MEMRDRALMSVVTADHFQHYIPLFSYTAGNHARIEAYLRGTMDRGTRDALALCPPGCVVNENYWLAQPFTVSATNILRFLVEQPGYWHVLITDIDFLLFEDPFPWHIQQMKESHLCFGGHHGPYHKPHRPEVCPSWTGDWERVAGGFFMTTPEWYIKTKVARDTAMDALMEGKVGGFRESDEVTLARIIKESGLPVPTNRVFPLELRGVHLGDFKRTMRHRWTDPVKMASKLSMDNCVRFLDLEEDPTWQEILRILSADRELMQILDNVRTHIQSRGL